VKKWFALIGLAATVGACGGDNDPMSRLMSFRSVAIRATRVVQSDTCDAGLVAAPDSPMGAPKLGKTGCDTPGSYAHPGDELQFELLWHDPDPDAVHEWAWTFCVNPPSSSILGCFQKLAADLGRLPPEERQKAAFSLLRSRPRSTSKNFETNDLVQPNPDGTKPDTRTLFRLQVPANLLDEFAGKPPQALANAMLGVVFVSCPGRLEPQLAGAGSRTDIPLKCKNENDEELGYDQFTIGIKRVFIRRKDENNDPRVASVLWDGQPWGESDVKIVEPVCAGDENNYRECSGAEHKITPVMQQPFADVGTDELGQAFNEQVIIQYYATEGLFEFDVKRAADPETHFRGRGRNLGPHTMWILTRDNRGGVSWLTRKFEVK